MAVSRRRTTEAVARRAAETETRSAPIHTCYTVGYNYVKIFHTPGCRNPSRDYSRQY